MIFLFDIWSCFGHHRNLEILVVRVAIGLFSGRFELKKKCLVV